MLYRTFSAAVVVGVSVISVGFIPSVGHTENATSLLRGVAREEVRTRFSPETSNTSATTLPEAMLDSVAEAKPISEITTVPFYSQFTDISAPKWRGVGCGIASLAMLIDYYSDEDINVDTLLAQGVAMNAFLTDAGWTHSGLIALSHKYGLDGASVSLSDLSMTDAFAALEREVEDGPVMVSVHYTFEPTNPIPHLVVVADVKDGQVYYNDPAETGPGGTISIEQFKKGWKKRYIAIRPQ